MRDYPGTVETGLGDGARDRNSLDAASQYVDTSLLDLHKLAQNLDSLKARQA